jgi:hypothetical protein
MTAVFESRTGGTMILVRREAVPGLMGEKSSMALSAESRHLLDSAGLTPCDRLRLAVRELPDRVLVIEIQKIR